MAKVSLLATLAAMAVLASACSDMDMSQDSAQQAQAAKDTPFYTQMPAASAAQNPSLTEAPSLQTDSMDPNTTPINP